MCFIFGRKIVINIVYYNYLPIVMKQTFQLNPITFPLWWYSTGLSLVFNWCKRSYQFALKKSKFSLFVRYMGAPLYGDYTRSGRIISFLLRVVLLLAKVFALGFRIFGLALLLFGYVIILPLALFMIVFALIPL